MNKLKLLLVGLLSIVALSACKSNKTETPEDVTKAFVVAFWTGDFDHMYKLTPQNNRQLIQQLQQQMTNHQDKLENMKKNDVEIIEVKCISQNDSVAECECEFTINKANRTTSYELRKENDCWLVDLRSN